MHTVEFRKQAVRKFELRGSRPIGDIARELGISTWTLHSWRKQATTGWMAHKKKSRIRSKRNLSEKQELLLKTAGFSEKELGEFLRREGLYAADLEKWKLEIADHLRGPSRTERSDENKLRLENVRLSKDLHRKDRALAETTALLVLKKKADLLFGTVDEDNEE